MQRNLFFNIFHNGHFVFLFDITFKQIISLIFLLYFPLSITWLFDLSISNASKPLYYKVFGPGTITMLLTLLSIMIQVIYHSRFWCFFVCRFFSYLSLFWRLYCICFLLSWRLYCICFLPKAGNSLFSLVW